MTIEEAIKDIKECIQPSVGGISLEMTIKVLEKQIPKEPKLKKFVELMRKQYCNYIECPTCGYRHGILEFKTDKNRIFKERSEWLHYCYNCGQKMDWGVEE